MFCLACNLGFIPAVNSSLGLGLCRQVVSELGGRLELEPGDGDCGAVLRVEVPLRSLLEP